MLHSICIYLILRTYSDLFFKILGKMGLFSMLVGASPLAELIITSAASAAKGGGLVLATVNPVGLAMLATAGVVGVVTVALVADSIQDTNRQKKSNSGSKKSKAANGSKPKRNNGQNNGNNTTANNNKALRPHEWAGFQRDPDRDKDLTGENPTCKLDAREVIRQLLKAYKIALQKLEEAIREIDPKSKKKPRTYFPLDEWKVTR